MTLLRLIRDREGAFGSNRKITCLSDLSASELKFILGYFKKFDTSLQDEQELSHEALLMKVCNYFHVRPESHLVIIDTLQDLCVAAARVSQGLPLMDEKQSAAFRASS